ncbi:ABC transporter permease, partial [Candidatus Bipolaricaulota bacterium]|nr:ABC transporter permease [Candidatus Bipolaricaulota bacterium]
MRRSMRPLLLVLGMGLAVFALAVALGVHGGVDAQFAALIDSIGRNLIHLAPVGKVGELPCLDQYRREDLAALANRPGIAAVAGHTPRMPIYPTGPDEPRHGGFAGVTANYLDLLGYELAAGRSFEEGETSAAVLGAALAKTIDTDPIGQLFDAGLMTVRVVGVLAMIQPGRKYDVDLNDMVIVGVDDYNAPMAHMAWRVACDEQPFAGLWVKLDADHIAEGIASIDAFTDDKTVVQTLEAQYAFAFRERRRTSLFYAIVALAILYVALINATSIASMTIAERIQEIGTRRALGSTGRAESRRVLCDLMLCAAGGLAMGGATAWSLAPTIGKGLSIELRFGALHIAAAGALLVAALVAGWIPARRAGRVSLLRAIRRASAGSDRSLYRGLGLLVLLSASLSIAATLLMASFSDEMERLIARQLGPFDPNVLAMAAEPQNEHRSFLPPLPLSSEDAEAVLELPGVDAVSGEFSRLHRVAAGERVIALQRVFHATALEVSYVAGRLIEGRWPTEAEFALSARVILLGSWYADWYFEGESAIGGPMTVDGEPYTVIGVFEAPWSQLENIEDGTKKIVIPARPNLGRQTTTADVFWLRLSPVVSTAETLQAIEALLEARHPGKAPPYFEGVAADAAEFVDALNSITYGLLRLAALGLVLSGAGVANLMWARVRQARQVLGIRRALGESGLRVFWRVASGAVWMMLAAGAIGTGLALAGLWPLTQSYY